MSLKLILTITMLSTMFIACQKKEASELLPQENVANKNAELVKSKKVFHSPEHEKDYNDFITGKLSIDNILNKYNTPTNLKSAYSIESWNKILRGEKIIEFKKNEKELSLAKLSYPNTERINLTQNEGSKTKSNASYAKNASTFVTANFKGNGWLLGSKAAWHLGYNPYDINGKPIPRNGISIYPIVSENYEQRWGGGSYSYNNWAGTFTSKDVITGELIRGRVIDYAERMTIIAGGAVDKKSIISFRDLTTAPRILRENGLTFDIYAWFKFFYIEFSTSVTTHPM